MPTSRENHLPSRPQVPTAGILRPSERPPRRGRSAFAARALLAVGILIAATGCAAPVPGGGDPGRVRVLGSWEAQGPEYEAFRAVVAPFERRTGIEVEYSSSRNLQGSLETSLKSGTAPDVAGLPGPGYLAGFARSGNLVDLAKVIDVGAYKRETAPAFVDLGTVDSRLYGVFIKATVKGMLWYNPAVYRFGAVTSWTDLMSRITVIGEQVKPWCVGLASEASSGWPGTDWIEDFVLRQSGPDIYDGWVEGRVKWTSPQIRKAFLSFGAVVADGAVAGGAKEAIRTHFGTAGDGLFTSPPRCLLTHQGSFITSYLDDATHRLGGSYDFMPFPAFDGRYEDALVGAGDLFALLRDSGPGRQLIQYLVTAEAQSIWVGRGGALSGNMNVTTYPDSISRREARLLGEASVFRFDASDSMPDAMNMAFWQAVLDYAANPVQLDSILARLDAVQATSY